MRREWVNIEWTYSTYGSQKLRNLWEVKEPMRTRDAYQRNHKSVCKLNPFGNQWPIVTPDQWRHGPPSPPCFSRNVADATERTFFAKHAHEAVLIIENRMCVVYPLRFRIQVKPLNNDSRRCRGVVLFLPFLLRQHALSHCATYPGNHISTDEWLLWESWECITYHHHHTHVQVFKTLHCPRPCNMSIV